MMNVIYGINSLVTPFQGLLIGTRQNPGHRPGLRCMTPLGSDDGGVLIYYPVGQPQRGLISPGLDIDISYIANQKEHHHQKTFQEEYLGFLKQYKVDYDERYLWDYTFVTPFQGLLIGTRQNPGHCPGLRCMTPLGSD
jgi:hypothetical protein